jgi:hypothetical protein
MSSDWADYFVLGTATALFQRSTTEGAPTRCGSAITTSSGQTGFGMLPPSPSEAEKK